MSDDTPPLFEVPPAWAEHWGDDMPEFHQEDARPDSSIKVLFANADDRREFLELMGAGPRREKAIWYPMRQWIVKERAEPTEVPVGKYPVYVISKGRADSRHTSKQLERLGLPYRIVVEPEEREAYAEHIDREKILVLPHALADLGQGSIPARNFVWEHAISEGAKRHWIVDDNIRHFFRLNHNRRTIIDAENPFSPCEEFADRYENVALAGLNYAGFIYDKAPWAPYRLNTRVYSCILIDNALPFRWRGRYNEDTDLSLRVLKAGYCTVLFNAYLINKVATMEMAGGNTDELYAGDGRLRMAESLREQHPDCVTIMEKWGRPQHHVDYSRFRFNSLRPVGQMTIDEGEESSGLGEAA